MAVSSPKRVIFTERRRSNDRSRLIYDDPYVFRVRSSRARSCFVHFDDDDGAKSKTRSSRRKKNPCNWEDYMAKKSKHAIQTPYALCDLTIDNKLSEFRPPFINYGGYYGDKQQGEKRTFNSLAVHQLKHQEITDERLSSLFRERRLRRDAEQYFRQNYNNRHS